MRCFMPDAVGFADTGYPCRADRASAELSITGPPPGIVSVGGYRFKLDQLQELVSRTDPNAILAALPDTLAGHRLAGSALQRTALRRALNELGVNPLDQRRVRRTPQNCNNLTTVVDRPLTSICCRSPANAAMTLFFEWLCFPAGEPGSSGEAAEQHPQPWR